MDYKYSRRNTRLAFLVGRGLLPRWLVRNRSLLFTFFTNLVRCTSGKMRFLSPQHRHVVHSNVPDPGAGGQVKRKGKERQRFTRVSVESGSHKPPNKSICSICQAGAGEEKRNPSESVRHIDLCPESRRESRRLSSLPQRSPGKLGCLPGLAVLRAPRQGLPVTAESFFQSLTALLESLFSR